MSHPPLLVGLAAPSSAGASQRWARSTRPSSTRNCARGFWRAPSRRAAKRGAHERERAVESSRRARVVSARLAADGPRAAAGDGGVRRPAARARSLAVRQHGLRRSRDAAAAAKERRRCAGSTSIALPVHRRVGRVRVAVVPAARRDRPRTAWNGSGISDRSCHALRSGAGGRVAEHVRRARERRRAARARRQVRIAATLRARGSTCSARAASSPPSRSCRACRASTSASAPNASETSLERLVAHCDSLTALDLSMCSQTHRRRRAPPPPSASRSSPTSWRTACQGSTARHPSASLRRLASISAIADAAGGGAATLELQNAARAAGARGGGGSSDPSSRSSSSTAA